MADVAVRQYRQSDLEACRALWTELVQVHRGLYDDSSIGGESPGLHFDQHIAQVGADHVWVAESEGAVSGLVGLTVRGRDAEVEPIVVSPSHRGKGLGRALLKHAVAEAQKKGAMRVCVRPVARNQKAISFFYDSGFCALGQVELVMDLCEPPSVQWQPGPNLFGHEFQC